MSYPPAGFPPAPPPWQPPTLQLSGKDVRDWWARVELDRARRKRESERWKRLFTAYLPPMNAVSTENLKANIHFRNCSIKMAEIWAQLPELALDPLEPLRNLPQVDPNTGQPAMNPQTGQPIMAAPEDIIAIKRAVLNKLLGRDHANVGQTIEEALFDVFQTSGVGGTKICYESDIKHVPAQPAPMIPGQVLGLTPDAAQTQPVAVNERWRWYRFSPEKLGIPAAFLSTDYDRAPYLFMEFAEPFTPQAAEHYKLPPTFRPTASYDDRVLSSEQESHQSSGNQTLLKGVEIWLHAAQFDPNEVDQDVFYRLVLIEGLKDTPAIYEFSPYQSKDASGRLTSDSLIGNPIHPCVLRVASDTGWVPSDAAFTDPLVQIEDRQIRIDVKLQEANLPRFAHAASIGSDIDKLSQADAGQGVSIADDLIRQIGAENLIIPIPHLERAQSDIEGRQMIRNAQAETLGLSANQAGNVTSTKRSATENAIVQANVSVRLRKEQNRLLDWYLTGVRKFDALVQRYMTQPGYVQIVGADGARKLQPYTNAHLSGRYAYDAHPDSQLTMDQASRIKRATDFVNYVAKSPLMNQAELMRLTATEFGFNAARLIQPPPQAPPDKPNISFAFKAEDLAIPEVRAILQSGGIKIGPISPEAQLAKAAADAKLASAHGGIQDKANLLNKHQSELSGRQPGVHPLNPAEAPPASPHLPHLPNLVGVQ